MVSNHITDAMFIKIQINKGKENRQQLNWTNIVTLRRAESDTV